jgi:hypothetical protein
MATTKQPGRDLLTPDEYIDLLEEIRAEKGGLSEERVRRQTVEQIAAAKREIHKGGDGNHRFEGERYLGIPNEHKDVRRIQLRKLVDEGGQDSVGGPVPSHPTLQKWHSEEFGVSPEEIHRLEMDDAPPESLISNAWRFLMHRDEPWPVKLGSAMPGEGGGRLPQVKAAKLRALDDTRELYQELGIKNIERAMKNQIEHSPVGADDAHGPLAEEWTRDFVNTPEMQEALRKVFILSMTRRRF